MKKIVIAGYVLLLMQPVLAQDYQFYSNNVVLYEHGNFGGQSKSFGVGTYRFNTAADFNDLASSIKVPAGFGAVLYEHANEAGGYGSYIDLLEDCADLSVYGFNDHVSYLVVFSLTSRPGYVYVRNKMINGQFKAWLWERAKANGTLPDNSPPAVASSIPARTVPATPKPVNELTPVYRVELRIITGNGAGEDEDKEVYVKLSDTDKEYFLDYGPDDFELGSDQRFDIVGGGGNLAGIKQILIGVKGDDMWGIKRVDLYVNNSPTPVFRKSYEESYRINGVGNYPRFVYYDYNEIRSNSYWKAIPENAALTKLPAPVPFTMIKSMVESMVGNQMHHIPGGKLFWGNTSGANTVTGDHVEGKRLDGNTLHFDLDLEYEVTGTNPEIDVDFDLEFTCISNGSITIKTGNVKIGCEVLGLIDCQELLNFFNNFIQIFGFDPLKAPALNGDAFSQVFKIQAAAAKCKGVLVNPNGDVFIY